MSYLLVHLVLACSRLLVGSWCSWHGKNITIGASVPIAKAQQPCGRCSRTANVESTTNRVYPHSPKHREQPLVSSNTIFKFTKTRFYMTHVTLEFHRGRPKRFLRIWYVRCKPCTYLVSRLALYQMNWIKHPLELCHRVLSGASKMISEPTVCLAQTMHLSWTDTNTISKLTKTRFHMTHIT
jgi:hypothetical protein